MLIALSSLLLSLSNIQTERAAYDNPWKGFAERACAPIRARRPDLVRFWSQPTGEGRRTDDPPRSAKEGDDQKARWSRVESTYALAIAARDEGRIQDALTILYGGILDSASDGPGLYDEYVYLLARTGRWSEVRDVIGANLDGEQGTSRAALLGVALVETNSETPELETFARRYLSSDGRIPAEEMDRLYPRAGGRATLRRMVWTVYAQTESLFIGTGQSRIWAGERALALDPTGPLPVLLRVRAIVHPTDGQIPIPDRGQAVAEAGRLIRNSLARLDRKDETYLRVWSSYEQFDKKAARRLKRPIVFNPLTGTWIGG